MPAVDTSAASPAKRDPARYRVILGGIARLVILAVGAATAIAAVARFHWTADLATHFRLQYAAAALVAGAVVAWTRRPVWALSALALLAFNGYSTFDPEPQAAPALTGAQPFRLLVANVFYVNTEYGRVIAFVREKRPDAAVFIEVTPAWRRALTALEGELPYATAMTGHRHGLLVMSRWPIASEERLVLAPGGNPFIRTQVTVGDRELGLIAVHAAWPLGSRNSRIRNRQLASMAALAVSLPNPLLIAGDFNTTPYSPHFADLLARGGLRSAAWDRRWAATWPTFFLPAGIQIDHVLVSRSVGVRRFETGPAVGSDHLPLVVDLAF